MALLGFKTFEVGENPSMWRSGWAEPTAPDSRDYIPGRFGGTAYSTQGSYRGSWGVTFTPPSPVEEMILGYAFRTSTQMVSSRILQFETRRSDTFATQSGPSFYITNGQVEISGISGVAILSHNPIAPGTWHYLEVRYLPRNNEGIMEIRLDGAQIFSYVGDTYMGTFTPAGVSKVYFLTVGNGDDDRQHVIQDLYVCDASGPSPYNTYLGDVTVSRLIPSEDGSANEFVGSDGDSVDNYLNVQSLSEETYNESDTPGSTDLYRFEADPGSQEVLAVEVSARASSDGGTSSVSLVSKLGESRTPASPAGLGIGVGTISSPIQTVDPEGNPWTISSVEASEHGLEIL